MNGCGKATGEKYQLGQAFTARPQSLDRRSRIRVQARNGSRQAFARPQGGPQLLLGLGRLTEYHSSLRRKGGGGGCVRKERNNQTSVPPARTNASDDKTTL